MGSSNAKQDSFVINTEQISKNFPGVQALKEIDFQVKRGEAHALVGENGAGKSTLMKILVREYREDKGNVFIEEQNIKHLSIRDVHGLGLSLIHQDLNLVPMFSVAHNICLGVEPVTRFGTVDWNELRRKADPCLGEVSSDIDLDAKVEDLSISQQQLVTVARALVSNPRILILDEPTARLDQKSTESLFQFLDRVRKRGITIVFISHRLEEIYRICDRITVLRDGKKIITAPVNEISQEALVKHIIGRELKQQVPKEKAAIGEILLSVKGLQPETKAEDIGFEVKSGEILGIVGSIGAGKSEVARALFGADRKKSGIVEIHGKDRKIRDVKDGIGAGLALVPEERKNQGLVLTESIRKNATLCSLRKRFCTRRFWIKQNKEKEAVNDLIMTLNLATPSGEQEAQFLSGGTQQKVVVGKWLLSDSNIYIFDEPTKGIDVGGKHDIYKMIVDLAKRGAGVIFISNELDEVLALCDRTLVMFNGRIVKEVINEHTTKNELLFYVMGGKDSEGKTGQVQ
jgi:ABC-type sugar transport system ATPase subunit